MPIPREPLILADIGQVYACIHDRRARGGCGYYHADCSYKPVTNLGWLLRNSWDVHDLWVSTQRLKSLAIGGGPPFGYVPYRREDGFEFDAILAARLSEGRVYVATWQDRTVLKDWLRRPKMLERLIHWNCRAYIIGSHEYNELKG